MNFFRKKKTFASFCLPSLFEFPIKRISTHCCAFVFSFSFWSVVQFLFWLSSTLIPNDLTVNRKCCYYIQICIFFIIQQTNAKYDTIAASYYMPTPINCYTIKYANNFESITEKKELNPTKTISTPHSNRFSIEKFTLTRKREKLFPRHRLSLSLCTIQHKSANTNTTYFQLQCAY